MIDFVSVRRGRNVLSGVVHVGLNVLLAVGSTWVTMVSGWWGLGVALVFISKWRIFAVRPRYWWINVKANLVDIVVGVSFVLLVYFAGTEMTVAQVVITILYIGWLVGVKPRSSEVMTEAQALLAVLLGISAACLMAVNFDPVVMVVAAFVIGYGASRHVLTQSEDHDFTMVTFVFGMVMAELSWVMYHWLIVYSFDAVVVPQMAVIDAVAFFVFMKGYKSLVRYDGRVKARDVVVPAIFSGLIILIMVIWFSKPIFDV
jgi:hypothetical protein